MADLLDVLRTEKKYLVSPIIAGQIAARLSYILKFDRNCVEGKPYIIKSVYFDSIYDMDFHEKDSGLESRKKIRLRSYGNDSPIKLELKQKQGSKQRKQSIIIAEKDAKKMLTGNYNCLLEYESNLAKSLYGIMTSEVYRPKCLVKYKRLAFTVPTNDIRVTIDSEISSQEGNMNLWEDDISAYPVIEAGNCVLEVKYNHFMLDYIKMALSEFGLTETANSKYCAGRKYGLGGNI